MTNTLSRISVLFMVLFSTACTQQLTIETPVDEAVLTAKPSLYKVTFTNGIPASVQLVLNSTDVTDVFTFTEQGAEADGTLLEGYVFSGKNEFSARTGVELHLSVFYYDDTGPAVHILSADHATGRMTGYLKDPSGVVSLTVNGTDVTVDAQNHFDSPFISMPFNEFLATDSNGYQSSVTYARADQQLFPSMSLRLNNDGFAFITDQLETGLADFNFEGLLELMNPVIDGIGYSGGLSEFYFDRPDINIVVQDDESMKIHIDIPNFTAAVDLRVLLLIHIKGSIRMDHLIVDSDALIDIVNSDVDVAIANTAVTLDGLELDLNSDFWEAIFEGLTQNFIDIFVEIMESLAVPLISDLLGEILIQGDINLDDNGVVETLHLLVTPTYLDTFNQGLTVDINAALSAPLPSPAAVRQIGSEYKSSDLPSLGNVTPNGRLFDVGVSLSANLINQALYAAHEAGITTMRITTATAAGVSPEGLSVIQTKEDDIQVQDIVAMRLEPVSPPLVTLMEGNNLHGMLVWHDVSLEFDLKRVGWENFRNIFAVKFNLEVPFELGATDEGFLHIGIEQLPIIEIVDTIDLGLIKISSHFMNSVIEHAMPVVLPTLTALLDVIPLPTIGGYRIHADELWVSGDGDRNFSLAGSLVKETVTEQAIAPTSTLTLTTNTVVNVENSEATIDISENINMTTEPLEHRYRVDGGAWSNWKQRRSVRMHRMLGGHHKVEVCSRTVLMKEEVSCPSAEFNTSVIQ